MSELAVVDNMIGNHVFAINLIACPSQQTKSILCAMQDQIFHSMPADTVYKCPEHSLHMSVFQLVHPRKSDSPDQASIWNGRFEKIDKHLRSTTNVSEPCILKSPWVHVSESAVIIQFTSSPGIELLRDQLEVNVQQSDLAWNRPSIQHITICRYSHSFQLRDLTGKFNGTKLPNLVWKIESLSLVQENTYPYLDNNLIQNYALGDGS